MERKTLTFKMRTLRIVLEIAISLACLGLVSLQTVSLLYGNGLINTSGKEYELHYELLKNASNIEQISDYLRRMKVDYAVYDRSLVLQAKEMEESRMLFAEKALETQSPFDNGLERYLWSENKAGLNIIIRIPMLPEFSDRTLRQKYDFHTLFNRAIIIAAATVVLLPFIRFIRDIREEFYILNDCINSGSVNETENHQRVRIEEIKHSIFFVEEMKKKLMSLIDAEKKEKEDLLFQVAALSHDLKTPLTIIKGNAALLDEADTKEEREECLMSIDTGIKTIEDYLDEMILYSKLVLSSKEKDEVQIGDLYHSIFEKIKGLQDGNIGLEANCASPDERIFCSRTTVERAVLNILSNAFEHAKTKVRFDLRRDEEFVFFEIYNDGKKISEEVLEHIGGLFFTEDKGRNSKNHYGLGLYFSRRIAEEHGGRLTAENLKQGVLFRFTIAGR
ncbi:MAG: HAMP domain-containing sensor histidine kinase [Peptostreptococcaceae bacterium]|nr:HAMP domain-containing sensor histidine kinase [Peptostreptococcaceae bacterium]